MVSRGGEAVDLGTAFAVGDQAIETDTGQQGTFPVSARHLNVGTAIATPAVVPTSPTKDRRQDEDLPWFELDTHAGQLTLGVCEQFDEPADTIGLALVKNEHSTISRMCLQVIKLSSDRQLHPLARRDLP